MNHWPFILAAYGIAVAATLALTIASYVAMRRAEARADALGRR
ncbi:heme exporter protein CcmD [Sphingomonas jatrophae]|uniref:Heme exporter protein D n=1 Tax=Sphingomonas jatrophae TaxID=1166337 RepID=A0A1I6JC82_9SPHN|nr:heme exporter protein CcmD [Sphingomonas jatrophae]SFR76559.1 Heme exporter protein D (CcmD) [Sphingomonas jatrophae]